MDDVHAKLTQQLQRGAAKKNEALGVVGIISRRRAVEKFSIEVPIGANHVDAYAFVDGSLKNR